MRQRAIIGALLLVGVGVALGATVFRTDIAQATGLAQSVTVDNTAANPVPVREQVPMAQDSFFASGGGGGSCVFDDLNVSSVIISSTRDAPVEVTLGFANESCEIPFVIGNPRIRITLPGNESVALSLPERLRVNAVVSSCPGDPCAFSVSALGR
jgi:hypothetical protein